MWLILILVVSMTACSAREVESSKEVFTTTFVPPPSTATTSRSYTNEELQRNTIAFKQKTGLGVDQPVQGKNFKVEYEGYTTAYYVTIQALTLTDYRDTKIEAEKVFTAAGVSDLCSIKIIFIPPKNLGNQPTVQDSLATGCRPYTQ